jgi:broad-specificity NMP kinase
MKKIYITSIAGTGKSTLAKVLKERGFDSIDVDHVQGLCSWFNNETGKKVFNDSPNNKFIDEHDYRCDISMLENLMQKSSEHVFVFGSVGDNSDFIPLFDTLVLLQCEPKTLIQRLKNRDTNPFGKETEVQNRMLEWKKVFDKLMLQAGAISISTEQDIETVADEVLKLI